MNFVIKIFAKSEYADKRLFFLIFIGLFFLLIASPGIYDVGYSKQNETNSTLKSFQFRNIPQFINESYTNRDAGFHILLPGGWSGLSYQNKVMISPAGMNIRTGNLGSLVSPSHTVLMVIEALNVSDFVSQKMNYSGIEENDCRIVSNKYVKINGMNGQELLSQCGSDNDNKIINYIFGSRDEVIIVGLKGSNPVFDSHLDKFTNSVGTLSIDKPIDIRNIG